MTMQLATLLVASALIFTLGCNNESLTENTSENRASSTHKDRTPDTVSDNNLNSYAADADGLRELFTALQDTIRYSDTAKAATITRGLFPDEKSLQQIVKDPAAIEKIKTMHQQFSGGTDDEVARLFAADSEQTEVRVYQATTEEIVAYEKGTVARAQFTDGAKYLAENVFRSKKTFYNIDLVKPGKKLGMAYHLFFHDGDNWKMLGPAWRAFR